MNHTTRHCLACNKIIRGRIDKKYCNDHCRNNYNNQQRMPESSYVRQITQNMRRNRNILMRLLGNMNQTLIERERLIEQGFRFRYHTHIENTMQGEHLICCYDMAYRTKNDDEVWVQRLNEEE